MQSKGALALTLLVPLIASCASPVRPNVIPGAATPTGVPMLTQTECSAGGYGSPLPAEYSNMTYVPRAQGELGGLALALLSSLIGKGVDLFGQKLAARGEEKTTTLEAQLNIDDPNMRVSCFELTRDDGLRVRFAMLPSYRPVVPGNIQAQVDQTLIEVVTVALVYPRTINLENSGTRGLSLTIETLRPNEAEPISQTISFRNVQVGSSLNLGFENNPFTSAYMQSPFVKREEPEGEAVSTPRIASNLPFTLRARLTEIRNANELYKLGGAVVQENKNAIVEALLKALGAEKENEPGNGAAGNNGPNDNTGQPPSADPHP